MPAPAALLAVVSVALPAAVPSFQARPPRAALGSAVEVRYTWTAGASFERPGPGWRAVVEFRDRHGAILFTDDHAPSPTPDTWLPGKAYTYERTVFVPVHPYVGPVQVYMGLLPAGQRSTPGAVAPTVKAGTLELLPQTENIFLVYKEGWHMPEVGPESPDQEFVWTKQDAVVAFKNPRQDVFVYLEAGTDVTAFARPPVLTLRVGGTDVATVPIADSSPFLKKVKVGAATLGGVEWVDLHLSMNGSFSRADAEHRDLGLRVLHLYVGEAARLAGVP